MSMRRAVLTTVTTMAVMASVTIAAPPSAEAQSRSCAGRAATIVGTSGADTLIGTPGPDVIVGLGGSDVIRGLGGDDVLCGGGGADRIEGGGGNDLILGGKGRDRLFGNRGPDIINGGTGNDRLKGGKGDDDLRGGGGRDRIFGGPQDDTLRGGNGFDVLRGNAGDDFLDGESGSDRVDGGPGTDFCVEGLLAGCAPSRIGTEISSVASDRCSNGGWTTGTREIDGRVAEHTLTCLNDDVGDTGWIEYDLGRRYRRFRAVLGIDDTARSTDHVYRYRVYGDGALLGSFDVGFGSRQNIDVGVSDVLRLRLELTLISGTDNRQSRAVWASPTAYAATEAAVAPLTQVIVPPERRIADMSSVHNERCSNGGWLTGVRTLNGVTYTDSLYCLNDDVGDNGSIEYNLSRAYGLLRTTVGIHDASPSATDTYRITITGDGAVLSQFDVPFGSTRDVDVSVEGVLRLVFEVEKVGGPTNGQSWATFGEPVLTR